MTTMQPDDEANRLLQAGLPAFGMGWSFTGIGYRWSATN